jgi:hypothetical protein
MPKKAINHRCRSFEDEALIQAQKKPPAPSLLNFKKDKTYTKKQLDQIHALRLLRYTDLLNSARNDDMHACIVFPTADQFEIPLSRISHSLETQVKLLYIYHYLEKRKESLSFTFTRGDFGPAIGVELPRKGLYNMLKREDEVFYNTGCQEL